MFLLLRINGMNGKEPVGAAVIEPRDSLQVGSFFFPSSFLFSFYFFIIKFVFQI